MASSHPTTRPGAPTASRQAGKLTVPSRMFTWRTMGRSPMRRRIKEDASAPALPVRHRERGGEGHDRDETDVEQEIQGAFAPFAGRERGERAEQDASYTPRHAPRTRPAEARPRETEQHAERKRKDLD